MLTDKTLGQVAYEAYRRHLFAEKVPIQPWAQAPLRIREAWMHAAQAVRAELGREGPQP